jgi:hypothetical protein
MSTYKEVEGNILFADEEYVVEECSCTSVRLCGLSAQIAQIWPTINPYMKRRRLYYNWCVLSDRPEAGTIQLFEEKGMKVICMFSQYSHGKIGSKEDPVMPDGFMMETSADRLRYFRECLEKITEMTPRPRSIAIPYMIGCGATGGSWPKYRKVIQNWSKLNPDIPVTIYRNTD